MKIHTIPVEKDPTWLSKKGTLFGMSLMKGKCSLDIKVDKPGPVSPRSRLTS